MNSTREQGRLRQVCRDGISIVTDSGIVTARNGFTAVVAFARLGEDTRRRVEEVLETEAAELPAGGALSWGWDSAGVELTISADGLAGCGQLELCGIAQGVVDAVCRVVEERRAAW